MTGLTRAALAAVVLAGNASIAAREAETCPPGQARFLAGLTEAFQRRGGTGADGHCSPVAGRKGGGQRFSPLAWGALAVVVHPDNPVDDLSLEQLRQVLQGQIVNWRQLGGGDRPLELQILHPGRSAVGDRVPELLFGDRRHPLVAAGVHASLAALERAVATNRNAVGVTAIDLRLPQQDLRALALDGVAPGYRALRSGAYPLFLPLYLAQRPGAGSREFLDFAHSRSGRRIIRMRGVVPYLEAPGLLRGRTAAATDPGDRPARAAMAPTTE